MSAYADSSIITALYVEESKSTKAQDLVGRHWPLPFTPWHRLEVRNAIRCATREDRAKAAVHHLENDIIEGAALVHTAIDWTDCLRRAEELSKHHNPKIGASSPDLFHIACALELGFEQFLTFDGRQFDLAKAVGLKVKV